MSDFHPVFYFFFSPFEVSWTSNNSHSLDWLIPPRMTASRSGCDEAARADRGRSGRWLWSHHKRRSAFQKWLTALPREEYDIWFIFDGGGAKLHRADQARAGSQTEGVSRLVWQVGPNWGTGLMQGWHPHTHAHINVPFHISTLITKLTVCYNFLFLC